MVKKINQKQYMINCKEDSTTSGAEGGYPFYEEESPINTLYQTMCFNLRMIFLSSPMCEAICVLKWLAIFKILLFL